MQGSLHRHASPSSLLRENSTPWNFQTALRKRARVDKAGAVWLNLRPFVVGYPSGQRGQTVNLLAYAFSGSNPEPTTTLTSSESVILKGFLLFSPKIEKCDENELSWLLSVT